MNKKELIKAIAEKSETSQVAVEKFLEALGDVVIETLKDGGSIKIVGFGTIEVVDTKERKGNNPKTGTPVIIPAGKKVKVKLGKQLKDAVK